MYGEMVPRRHLWVFIVVVALAVLLRAPRLDFPAAIYFDETYYANDAAVFIEGVRAYDHPLDEKATEPPSQPPPFVGLRGEKSWVHPDLGKWAIAAGEAAFGSTSPWGWRIVPALFGVGTVALVFLMGLELFSGSVVWAGLAAGFAALDGLLITQSRVAMLDAMLIGFVCLGAWCLLRDRRSPGSDEGPPWYGSGWRVGAGLAFGAATATKWSGALALLAALGLTVASRAANGRLRREAAGIALTLLAIPFLVYLASYAGWFAQHGLSPSAFVDLHRQIANYHTTLAATHTYESRAWTWPFLVRPVAYFYDDSGGVIRHILGVGNPGLWWPFVVAFFGLAGLARPDRWGARDPYPARFVLTFYLVQYLPWLLVPRALFLWYMGPVVPFMALGLVLAVRALPGVWRAVATGSTVTTVVVGAGLFLPLWIGYGMYPSWWDFLVVRLMRGTFLHLNWI